ncbi:oocyte zinc finger protein XlCOF20-like isoform X2 [Nymphalis io]|uniref:oocyte zinc finger protein XlCOF20-like isoform X2 n=1 Tax=Inachis io TaxID=171585 RepID=UPI002166DE08|nr:oocyte zinc finger protein XlCOF20-like isoform X2 [Nymphalis io]
MLQCCYCSKEFKYESEKKRHEQSHYPQFECNQCFKKFSFLSALRRHQKQHERTGSVQCLECGRNFRDDILLKRHIKYAHKGEYECSQCNAIFKSDLALMSHMKTHKPKAERRFQCSFEDCKKSFNFAHHLKHHELTHTNTKQFYCKTCGKGFIQSHHLKYHMKTHEPENWLYCTIPDCNKKFVSEYARKKHLTSHRTTIDSGISSDSNCDLSQDSIKADAAVLCAKCGTMIMLTSYEKHERECMRKPEMPEDKCLQPKIEIEMNNYNNIEVFSNCKTILGKCIANENLPNSCLCAQIKDVNNFYDELLPNENFDPHKVETENKPTYNNNYENISIMNNACEGCDCSNTKSNINSLKEPLIQNTDENLPKFEFRSDGAIKLKETIDISISIKKENQINDTDEFMNIMNHVPFNSCKAVLGKCIVSGSGTMSENCLCAKMAMDDHQMTAQEIDEITPQPTILA